MREGLWGREEGRDCWGGRNGGSEEKRTEGVKEGGQGGRDGE